MNNYLVGKLMAALKWQSLKFKQFQWVFKEHFALTKSKHTYHEPSFWNMFRPVNIETMQARNYGKRLG